jgi:hypothetical protein
VITIFSLVNNPKIWRAEGASLLSSINLSDISVDALYQLILDKLKKYD